MTKLNLHRANGDLIVAVTDNDREIRRWTTRGDNRLTLLADDRADATGEEARDAADLLGAYIPDEWRL